MMEISIFALFFRNRTPISYSTAHECSAICQNVAFRRNYWA